MRVKNCEAIRKAKKPADNATAEEQKAFQELKKHSDIHILHADKGNATVVRNAADYDRKAHDLDYDNSYGVLTKDPARSTEKAFLPRLRNLRKEGKITEEFYNKVRPSKGSSKPAE